MRRTIELEKRVAGLENRRPFQLRYFVTIGSKLEHDIFDRAKVGDEYFIRLDEESENQFRERIKQATDANPIWMFPHSIESDFRAQHERNTAQITTPRKTASKFVSGCVSTDLTPTLTRIEKGD